MKYENDIRGTMYAIAKANEDRNTERCDVDDLPPAGEGVFMVVGPRCWGKASNAAEAFDNAQASWPSFANSGSYRLYYVAHDAVIDNLGAIHFWHEDSNHKYMGVRLGEWRDIDKTFRPDDLLDDLPNTDWSDDQ